MRGTNKTTGGNDVFYRGVSRVLGFISFVGGLSLEALFKGFEQAIDPYKLIIIAWEFPP